MARRCWIIQWVWYFFLSMTGRLMETFIEKVLQNDLLPFIDSDTLTLVHPRHIMVSIHLLSNNPQPDCYTRRHPIFSRTYKTPVQFCRRRYSMAQILRKYWSQKSIMCLRNGRRHWRTTYHRKVGNTSHPRLSTAWGLKRCASGQPRPWNKSPWCHTR